MLYQYAIENLKKCIACKNTSFTDCYKRYGYPKGCGCQLCPNYTDAEDVYKAMETVIDHFESVNLQMEPKDDRTTGAEMMEKIEDLEKRSKALEQYLLSVEKTEWTPLSEPYKRERQSGRRCYSCIKEK